MDPSPNPFAALSLIVAPAILTNACSVLAMSTSNRLARAVDRARELSRQVEAPGEHDDTRLLHELSVNEDRAVLLLRVLRSFYTALGAFALATLVSLIGAVMAAVEPSGIVRALELLGVLASEPTCASPRRGTPTPPRSRPRSPERRSGAPRPRSAGRTPWWCARRPTSAPRCACRPPAMSRSPSRLP